MKDFQPQISLIFNVIPDISLREIPEWHLKFVKFVEIRG